ncbi:MAG: hypothetical protein PUA90_01135 [bacterium]|nr:hypothetical protein [bacterium]
MDTILDFLANYYMWFGIVSIALLFALFGMISNGKKKKSTVEVVDSQPISIDKTIDEKNEIKNDNPTLVIEESKQTQSAFEPSLEEFTSNVTDVKVVGMETPVESEEQSNMLVLDDTKAEMGNNISNSNESVFQNEEKVNEPQMLVLDDNKPELGTQSQNNNVETVNTPILNDNSLAQTTEPQMLVLDDNKPELGTQPQNNSVEAVNTPVLNDNSLAQTTEPQMLVLDDNTPNTGIEK